MIIWQNTLTAAIIWHPSFTSFYNTMKKFSFLYLLLFIVIATLSGCAQLTKQAGIVKPTGKLTAARLTNINFDQLELVFDLAIKNENPVALNLSGLDYELKIDHHSLLSGSNTQAMNVKAHSVSTVQLPVILKFDDLKKIPGKLWNKNKVSYELLSHFYVKLPVIGNYAIPVSKKGVLPVPKIPTFTINAVKINNLSFSSVDLVAHVAINNPNDFDMTLSHFNYQLSVNQKKWGQGKINKSNRIPAGDKGIIEIPISLQLLSAGPSAYAILMNNKPVNYRLTGSMVLDTGLELLKGQTIPLNLSGTTTFH